MDPWKYSEFINIMKFNLYNIELNINISINYATFAI